MCDDGYDGYDCSLLSCASGDNPHTDGQKNEVQTLYCEASLATASLLISFRRHQTIELTSVAVSRKHEDTSSSLALCIFLISSPP